MAMITQPIVLLCIVVINADVMHVLSSTVHTQNGYVGTRAHLVERKRTRPIGSRTTATRIPNEKMQNAVNVIILLRSKQKLGLWS
jgi:hypothetical protein